MSASHTLQSFGRTGDILLQKNVITREQLNLCLLAQNGLSNIGQSPRIGELILEYGFATQSEVEDAIVKTGRTADDLGGIAFPMPLLKRIKAYPLGLIDGVLRIAASGTFDKADEEDILAVAADAGLTVKTIEIVPCDRMEVLQSINRLATPDRMLVAAELREMPSRMDDSAFINQVINHIFVDALQSRASDIHIMSSRQPEYCWIAYRIDGHKRYSYMVAPDAMSVIATRIKSDAGMDYSDTMHPHDGRTSIRYNGRQIDIRVSTLPVDFGETIVIRLLDSGSIPSISRLFSMHPPVAHHIDQIIAKDIKGGGVFLVTGATGSGKSTTLNAILRAMDRSRRSIKTVEDPVELRVPLVGHAQVNESAGLTYGKVLRSLLRQDPDVIMIGELRDEDTVSIALKAAETGHMMVSTLHTGSVAESVNRLLNMMSDNTRNIGKSVLSGILKGVVNQKLIRRLCSKCSQLHTPDAKDIALLSEAIGEENLPKDFYRSPGCQRCDDTGYFGRAVVPEALFISNRHETRVKFEEILSNNRPFHEVFSLTGVTWYSREQAITVLLKDGVVDITSALSLLEKNSETPK